MASAPLGEVLCAVVVDFDSGDHLIECVRSVLAEGVDDISVVANGDAAHTRSALTSAGLSVSVIDPGANLGYGGGANRGVAASGGSERPAPLVLITNPDVRFHSGALATLCAALDEESGWAMVGPSIFDEGGTRYPSVRQFPSPVDAAGHAIVGLFNEDNPFTRRYRLDRADVERRRSADWISGACFVIRRTSFEELGGFDERYFMFAEDMDLCWRAHRQGWSLGVEPLASVTHAQGVTTRQHPYKMLWAHHRSALRFYSRTRSGLGLLTIPLAAIGLAARLVISAARQLAGAGGASRHPT